MALYCCTDCEATIATTDGHDAHAPVVCGNCGNTVAESRNNDGPSIEEERVLSDLDLLPPDLRALTINEGEILVPYDAAIRIIAYFETLNLAINRCECLLGTPDILRHSPDYPSLTTLPSGVSRTAAVCRETIQNYQKRFVRTSLARQAQLFFGVGVAPPAPA
jgi:hypothetical protein